MKLGLWIGLICLGTTGCGPKVIRPTLPPPPVAESLKSSLLEKCPIQPDVSSKEIDALITLFRKNSKEYKACRAKNSELVDAYLALQKKVDDYALQVASTLTQTHK